MSQCSECSVRVKPIVAIDIDGTMAEYHHHLMKHVERYFGLGDRYWTSWDGSGNYEDFLGITQEQYREAKLAFRQGGFKRWSPAYDGLNTLRSILTNLKSFNKVEVWITTTRPWNRLDSTDPDTRFWLDRWFPLYDHVLYHERKYIELARLVDSERVVAVIDDLPSMYQDAVMMFGNEASFLVERPHNEAFRRDANGFLNLAPDLGSFGRFAEKLVLEWEETHG